MLKAKYGRENLHMNNVVAKQVNSSLWMALVEDRENLHMNKAIKAIKEDRENLQSESLFHCYRQRSFAFS